MSVVLVKDIAERAVLTFLETWLGAWLVIQDHEIDQLFDSKLLGAAVIAAVLAVAKGIGASKVGEPQSASLSPDV